MAGTTKRGGRQAAAEKVTETLRQVAKERNAELMQKLAREVVDLRQHCTWEDLPDWGGRSHEYKDTMFRAFQEAGIVGEEAKPVQANLRYHLGNVIREIAPAEELTALGLDPAGPRERAVRARATAHLRRPKRTTTAVTASSPLTVMTDPLALASFALDAVRAIRALEPKGEMAGAVVPQLRRLSAEIFDALAEIR